MTPEEFNEKVLEMIRAIAGKSYERRTIELARRFSSAPQETEKRGIENWASPDYRWGVEISSTGEEAGFFELARFGGDSPEDSIIGVCMKDEAPKYRALIDLKTGKVICAEGRAIDGMLNTAPPKIANERMETGLPKIIRMCEKRTGAYLIHGL